MSEEKDTSVPTSCSAHGATPATARPERSNSLFRATVPVEELQRHIDEHLRQARMKSESTRTMYGDGEWAMRYYDGEIFALLELQKWLNAQPREQAPARNDKLSDGRRGHSEQ